MYLKKILASVCKICPLCILARRFPHSRFAAGMSQLETICPFCKAYRSLTRERCPAHNPSEES